MSGPGQRTRILLVGVGGQGVVTAAEVLGNALTESGLPVIVGQLHGMSQRGGSVEAAVVVGPGSTAFIGPGEADVVLAFEPLEALRAVPRMRAEALLVLNTGHIAPFTLAQSGRAYPELESVLEQLREVTQHVFPLDGPEIGARNGERTLNVAMLGALQALARLPLPAETLWNAIERRYPERYRDANRRAYELGMAAIEVQA